MRNVDRVPQIITDLQKLVRELEELFPGRRFTLDGHLVGSIGEVFAAHRYGLHLLPASSKGHDALSDSGIQVQIKTTQRSTVGIRSEPVHMIVLRLRGNGAIEEVFNGPGRLAWDNAGAMQKNGQRQISLTKLSALMGNVSPEQMLPKNTT
jgi:hypothetical protein